MSISVVIPKAWSRPTKDSNVRFEWPIVQRVVLLALIQGITFLLQLDVPVLGTGDKKVFCMKSLEEITAAVQQINIVRHFLADDGIFPNNPTLPLLVYQKALATADPGMIEDLLESNRWVNSWRNGIYDFPHYHSKAHEVLAVVKGSARVQFGGSSGVTIHMEAGDVAILPAGTCHQCLAANDLEVIGAYPEGQQYDVLKGEPGERKLADENIRKTGLPEFDPLYGLDGPLVKNWPAST